jgi:hypothetical protein
MMWNCNKVIVWDETWGNSIIYSYYVADIAWECNTIIERDITLRNATIDSYDIA